MLGKSKRILIFSTAYRPLVGGSELAIENITRRLPNIFFDVLTLRHSRVLKNIEPSGNLTVYRFGFGGRLGKLLFPIFGCLGARRLAKHYDYEVIHAYQASQAGGAAWLYKFFNSGVKLVVTLQEGQMLEKQNFVIKFFRWLILKKADLITTISSHLANYARAINGRAEIVIVPNGVDLARFKKSDLSVEELKKALLIKGSDRIIITVSRLVPKNGLGDLIESLPLVKNNLPDAKLIIIGVGPLEAKLKKQITASGLDDSVLFLGLIDHDLLPRYLKLGDIFVRPSHSEGLGSAFLEAMASGLPIIGTPVGGIPDFLKDRQTGLFCKAGDAADIAARIVEILTDLELRSKIIANGRRLVAEKFSWESIAKKFEDIYQHGA